MLTSLRSFLCRSCAWGRDWLDRPGHGRSAGRPGPPGVGHLQPL